MNDMPIEFAKYLPFIFMLGVTMIAAPGVPGGAVMAAVGLLSTMLGFSRSYGCTNDCIVHGTR